MCLQFLLYCALVASLYYAHAAIFFFFTLSPAPSVDYNVTEQTHENITRIFDLIVNQKAEQFHNTIFLAPVVQRADNFIHWIVRYPADRMCARFSR